MSHEVESMAWANQVPWHGLGARVDGDLTPDEMLVAAGLDWKVRLLPAFAEDETGTRINLPRQALVRSSDNKVLTVTGPDWKPMQNSEMLGFMANYVKAGGATLETAGSLFGGKLVWGLAKLNHSFDVSSGDKVEGYLLITSPHEVNRAIKVRTTTVRVVCANTMARADRNSETEYSQSHLSGFDFDAAHTAVQRAHDCLSACERRAKTLSCLKLSMEDAVRKVFVPTFEPELLEDKSVMNDIMLPESQPKRIQALLDSYMRAPGAQPGNGWGALNAVTHWADHVNGRTNATRLQRSWMGDTGRAKLKVEELLMELAS